MNTLRLLVIFSVGLTTFVANAQNDNPGIIAPITLLLNDNDTSNPSNGNGFRLRAVRGQEIDNQGVIQSTTSNTYDNLGRVVRRVQQTLDINGEVEIIDTSSFEYDSFGRASTATLVSTEPSGEIISTVDFDFIYIDEGLNSGSLTLDQYVFTITAEEGTSEFIQDFEYLGLDNRGLPRVSQVNSTQTTSSAGFSFVITFTDVPTYSVSDEDIISIQRSVTSTLGEDTQVTSTLGYNTNEQTSVITTGSITSSNPQERNLTFSSRTQRITRGEGNTRFINITEYEDGICDATNEENRRLIGIFSPTVLGNGLGRQCR